MGVPKRLTIGLLLLSLLAAAGSCANASRVTSTSGSRSSQDPPGVGSCALPSLPPVAGSASAVFDTGAVKERFALDGGDLVVDPPPEGVAPTVSGRDAECTDLASVELFGDMPANPLSPPGSGVSFGYGLVTVKDSLVTAADNNRNAAHELDAVTPQAAPPVPMHQVLAWVVVNTEQYVANCPMEPTNPSPPPTTGAPSSGPADDYGLFILPDAGNALIYYESSPAVCGGSGRQPASVAVPVSTWSVPWTLVSRDPHGYSATITSQVRGCDGYQPEVNADTTGRVQVQVWRPIGRACGMTPASMTLQAATVFDSLPTDLTHAPTGLELAFNRPPPSPPATAPHASIVGLGRENAGSTVAATVGTVFSVSVPGINPADTRAVSSDPAVVGDLGGGMEFKAWEPGRATVTAPCQAGTAPCTGPWTWQVVVS